MIERSAPRLAIVLGSGGVRSIAALGLFEVLAQERINFDLIVGCSAGAMFGALISIGHTADEATRIAATHRTLEVTRRRRCGCDYRVRRSRAAYLSTLRETGWPV